MMTEIYNFSAGPACLPKAVLEHIKNDIPDWYQGMSVMELSHRLPVMMQHTDAIENKLRKILNIPADFAVLFMPGGARLQFSAIPLNLLSTHKVANYLVTGLWSQLAYEDALKYGQIQLVASGQSQQYTEIPPQENWKIAKNAAYFHYADNETIHGVEFQDFAKIATQFNLEEPLVSDMTSNILTKAIDFEGYGLIYASAQKNLGIAGITVVIIRRDLLNRTAHPLTPSIMQYELFEQSKSLFNTPPVFCWYVLGLVLDWMEAEGGLPTFIEASLKKSTLLYGVIDQSRLYHNGVKPSDRSRINVPFTLKKPELEALFLEEASLAGLKQLKGHKAIGGIRASLYNAMPLAGVEALAQFMQDFEKKHLS